MNWDKDRLQKFTNDPDADYLLEFIESHFERTLDISDLDTTLSPETVHAEVIARKRIAENLNSLRASMHALKSSSPSQKVSFK